MRSATVLDVRRLTGPNVLARVPLVIVDVGHDAGGEPWSEGDIGELLARYLEELGRMRVALGLSAEVTPLVRTNRGGVTFGYAAPEDILLVCAEVSEWAITGAIARWTGAADATVLDLEPARETFAAMLAAATNPNMVALAREAERRDVPFLWDDDEVTVGEGRTSRTYPLASVPSLADIPWTDVGRIPVALVTGTNGKTTSTRLLAHCVRAGHSEATGGAGAVGIASSDGVIIGSDLTERGDWTGPAAARRVLRDLRVDVAVLETARGGILRRGLAVADADVALLTNVSADHLGGYGVDDVEAMAEVKAVVARAGRTVVLNARDPQLVRLGRDRPVEDVVYFADLEGSDASGEAARVVAEHVAAGGRAVVTRDGRILAGHRELGRADDVPITFRGAARYNVENVLGVIAAASALGVSDEAILRAIRAFDGDDNPRRGQLLERRGVQVFLDFGHNPEAVRASMGVVTTLRGRSGGRGAGDDRRGRDESRLTVVVASPGDRSDADIGDVARAIAAARPDRIFARDLPHYLRGRAPGEVPAVFARAFGELGVPDAAFSVVASEVEALTEAFAGAAPGDVVVVLVHLDRDEVRAFLDSVS